MINPETKKGYNGILYLTKDPKLYVDIPIEKAKTIENKKQKIKIGFEYINLNPFAIPAV